MPLGRFWNDHVKSLRPAQITNGGLVVAIRSAPYYDRPCSSLHKLARYADLQFLWLECSRSGIVFTRKMPRGWPELGKGELVDLFGLEVYDLTT
jgi:hypothetical protein